MFLKQSTATTIKMGPFVDDTDGKSAETALTITQSDIRLSKNGGAFAQKSDASSASHDENGYYAVALSAADTDTAGVLRVAIYKSGALPVWRDLVVIPAHIYDCQFGLDGLYEAAAKVLVNKAVQDKLTGAVQYFDDDGETVILTHTPSEDESSISRTPS